jgi:hypothetical protein
VEQIEKTNVQRHVEERKRKREGADASQSGPKSASEQHENAEKLKRNFRQQHAIGKEYGEQMYKAQSKLLNNVFAKSKSSQD